MIRRILIGALALVVLAGATFVTYGWWTRRGAPSFSTGGTFGATESPTPQAPRSPTGTPDRRPATEGAPRERDARAAASGVRAAAQPARTGPRISIPAEGTYRYAGTGTERVRFGPTSACAWDVEDVTGVLKHEADGVVVDWTYSSQHLERHVFDYRKRSVALEFAGAAVTCLGVRQTSEDRYEPPAIWVQHPWDVGERWRHEARAGERIEVTTAEVVARERIRVPAGRFTVYRIESTTRISGDSEGTHRSTTWFSPTLGLNVKRVSQTDVRHGSADYSSSVTLRLAATP